MRRSGDGHGTDSTGGGRVISGCSRAARDRRRASARPAEGARRQHPLRDLPRAGPLAAAAGHRRHRRHARAARQHRAPPPRAHARGRPARGAERQPRRGRPSAAPLLAGRRRAVARPRAAGVPDARPDAAAGRRRSPAPAPRRPPTPAASRAAADGATVPAPALPRGAGRRARPPRLRPRGRGRRRDAPRSRSPTARSASWPRPTPISCAACTAASSRASSRPSGGDVEVVDFHTLVDRDALPGRAGSVARGLTGVHSTSVSQEAPRDHADRHSCRRRSRTSSRPRASPTWRCASPSARRLLGLQLRDVLRHRRRQRRPHRRLRRRAGRRRPVERPAAHRRHARLQGRPPAGRASRSTTRTPSAPAAAARASPRAASASLELEPRAKFAARHSVGSTTITSAPAGSELTIDSRVSSGSHVGRARPTRAGGRSIAHGVRPRSAAARNRSRAALARSSAAEPRKPLRDAQSTSSSSGGSS